MLTPGERRELHMLERSLAESDPALAASLGRGEPRTRFNTAALRVALAVAGLALVAAGAALLDFPLLFLACNLLCLALTLHASRKTGGHRPIPRLK
ncbi:DUF3040 domain-containing protein [Amycolatopsis rhizosphaerae]|uniref:DUF3040 domain-containing protein n=1 Tax=Amycolatopsis rhizosphaerae TaxID=2053003 RepID=A0A558CSU3_9PSEU|nr:DUF3040 domain-containing protein [Amycolatopsis rhizosphaerae]TVT51851.1 DUF3040 domain-containing protein [Amycolatopsis rhizosphaerae]